MTQRAYKSGQDKKCDHKEWVRFTAARRDINQAGKNGWMRTECLD